MESAALGMASRKSGVFSMGLLLVSDPLFSVLIVKSVDWRSLQIRCRNRLLDMPEFSTTAYLASSDRRLLTEVWDIVKLEVSVMCQICFSWRKLRIKEGIASS